MSQETLTHLPEAARCGGGVRGDREIQTRSCVILKKANCHFPPPVNSDLSPDGGKGRAGGWDQLSVGRASSWERQGQFPDVPSHLSQGPPYSGAQDNSLCVYWELKLGPGGAPPLRLLEALPPPTTDRSLSQPSPPSVPESLHQPSHLAAGGPSS